MVICSLQMEVFGGGGGGGDDDGGDEVAQHLDSVNGGGVEWDEVAWIEWDEAFVINYFDDCDQ